MTERRILCISEDPESARPLACMLEGRGGVRVYHTAGTGDDGPAGRFEGFALVVVVLNGRRDLERVGDVLWSLSLGRATVPVVALAGRYDKAQALTLFQMGVTDYLGLREHGDRLGSVLNGLAGGRSPSPPGPRGLDWLADSLRVRPSRSTVGLGFGRLRLGAFESQG